MRMPQHAWKLNDNVLSLVTCHLSLFYALFAGGVLNLFDEPALGTLFRRAHGRRAAPSQDEHHHAEDQHDDAPPKIDVDAERAGVHGFVADQPEDGENRAEDG